MNKLTMPPSTNMHRLFEAKFSATGTKFEMEFNRMENKISEEFTTRMIYRFGLGVSTLID
jgi:hypothetical protein